MAAEAAAAGGGGAGLGWGMVAAAGLGALGSIYSGNKAADAMASGSAAANAVAENQFNQTWAAYKPYRDVGYNALNAYARAMGLPGAAPATEGQVTGPYGLKAIPVSYKGKPVLIDSEGNGYTVAQYGENKGTLNPVVGQSYKQYVTTPTAGSNAAAPAAPTTEADRYGGFYASPGYQFRFDQGAQAYDRSAAARGRLLSGAQVKAQTRYGQGVASEEFGNYTNRLAALAGVGQTAVANTANAGSSYAQNASANAMNNAMGRASSYLNVGNTIGSLANGFMAAAPYLSSGSNTIQPINNAVQYMPYPTKYGRI